MKISEDMLWDYADGFLGEAEKLQVESGLRQHPELQIRLDAIQAEKRAFAALPLEKPRAGFADHVMAAWVAEQTGKPVAAPEKPRDWILFSIAGVFAVFIVLAFVLVLGAAPETVPALIPSAYVPEMPPVDWSMLFDSALLRYGLILALSVLTLQILDKFLQQRRQQHGLMPGH